jgi:ferredoxin
MKRTIIKIDEELCNGCEACVHGCHEGALQMIDGKARMVSELYCDGLGACVGDCPVGAITLEEREAIPYDEIATIQRMIPKGEKTILAHLKHLKDHEEFEYLKQAVGYLKANNVQVDFSQVHNAPAPQRNHQHDHHQHQHGAGGSCPGSKSMSFEPVRPAVVTGFRMANQQETTESVSQLRQWPVQLHLLNPQAGYFRNADVVLAADCVPFSFPDFHNRFLAGKTLAIACPKLDTNKDAYVEKIKSMIIDSGINTLQVVIMEVPCCGSLLSIANKAVMESGRKIPVKLSVVGIRGEIISENWV